MDIQTRHIALRPGSSVPWACRPIGVRTLGPRDQGAIAGLVTACSAESLRDRFFGYVADPTAALLDQLREAVWGGAAVGAFLGDVMVAVAVGLPDPTECTWEIGVLVCDDYQGRRLGSRLVRRLLSEAASADVIPIAVVEASNVPSLRLLRRLRRTPEGAALRVDLC